MIAEQTLHWIGWHELRRQINCQLPGDLYDSKGRVLLHANNVLTEAFVEILYSHRVQIGEDWNSVREKKRKINRNSWTVIAELAKHFNVPISLNERRGDIRFGWKMPVSIWVDDPISDAMPQFAEATVADISVSGIGIECAGSICSGSRVTVSFGALTDQPELTGYVRYAVPCSELTHRIGIIIEEEFDTVC